MAALAAACVAPAAARAAVSQLPLAAYGFGGGVTVTGSDPRFDLYVPDYASARKMNVRFALVFSPIVDAKSIVTVTVDGAPIGNETVANLRKGATVGGTFANFTGNGRMLTVAVQAHLGVGGPLCHEYDPRAIWMRVAPSSAIAVERNDGQAPTPAQFFDDYDGRFAVGTAAGAPRDVKNTAIALGYWLHQFERWRQIALFYQRETPDAKQIVVGGGSPDLSVTHGVLHVTPHGLELLIARAAPDVTVKTQDGIATLKAKRLHSPATLDRLGIGTRTQRGTGDLTFPVSFALGTFGGIPHGLHAILELAHGAYEQGDRAAVTVSLNGAVINGFRLSPNGGTQRFDVPIDERWLDAANTLAVAVEYVPRGCARASMTASLLGSSVLRWNGVAQYAPTIGEFFNQATGTLGVAISGDDLDPSAFALLDRLGAIDPNLSRVIVRPYDGTAPQDVTETLYVATPMAVKQPPMSWDPQTGALRLSDDAGKTVFSVQPGAAYGELRAFRDDVPSLLATYTKAHRPDALANVGALSAAQLSALNSELALFDARGIVYRSSPHAILRARTPASPLKASWPLLLVFAAVVVVALILIAQRARRVS